MKKNNLEDVFSSLENFSATPPPELWGAIESKLEKPKKKKRAIIWWYGAVASLVIGLGIVSVWNNDYSEYSNAINKVVLATEDVIEFEKESREVLKADNNTLHFRKEEHEVADSYKGNKWKTTSVIDSKEDEIPIKRSSSIIGKDAAVSLVKQEEQMLSGIKPTRALKRQSNLKQESSEASLPDVEVKESNYLLAALEIEKTPLNLSSVVAIDSATVQKELLELEKILARTKEDSEPDKEEVVNNQWSIQLFAGLPNTQQNKESAVDGATSNTSNTYGVKTNYQLNKKWQIRAGVKLNDFGSKIARLVDGSLPVGPSSEGNAPSAQSNLIEVPLASSPEPSIPVQVVNADPILDAPNSSAIVVVVENESMSNVSNESSPSDSPITNLENKQLTAQNSTQQLRYIEIPVEVSYALLNKKRTSISLNTGGTLGKLVTNKVLLNGMDMGADTTANDYIYGILLSSTVQYKLFNHTYLFAEPGMNYYMKPVARQTFNQFNPSLNVGLNLSF